MMSQPFHPNQPPHPDPQGMPPQGPPQRPTSGPTGPAPRPGKKPPVVLLVALGALVLALIIGSTIVTRLIADSRPETSAPVASTSAPAGSADPSASPGTPAEQKTPKNGTASHGILLRGKAPKAGTPHMILYEDPQCPPCGQREEYFGPLVDQLVKDGEITAEVRFAYFLERGERDGASQRAAIAAATADEFGKFAEFHTAMFANQDKGYSAEQLRVVIPEQAGITGDDLASFQKLYDARAYRTFVEGGFETFNANKIGSTPTYIVSGKPLEFHDSNGNPVIQVERDSLLEAIKATYKAGGERIE